MQPAQLLIRFRMEMIERPSLAVAATVRPGIGRHLPRGASGVRGSGGAAKAIRKTSFGCC